MARETVEFLRVTDQSLAPTFAPLALAGMRLCVLSGDPLGGAFSAYGRLRPFWASPRPVSTRHELSLFLVAGSLSIGEAEAARGSFLTIPAGETLPPMQTSDGVEFFLFSDGPLTLDPAAPQVRMRTWHWVEVRDLSWEQSPPFEGRDASEVAAGLSVKWLERESGTGTYTLLTRHAPGWRDPRIEQHECWEELLLLQGDYLMGTTGALCGGDYIFRASQLPHGPQCTHGGAVWFCRGNRQIDFQYSRVPWADAVMDRYLQRPPARQRDCYPWGDWAV